MNTVISIESLSKHYRLGTINHGTLYRDLQSAWARLRGKPDPNQRIDATGNKTSFWALRNLSLELKEGEILGIIGRNGAGKSTLLKILSRVTAPTTGLIKIKGRIASLLEVGTGFHPELTGRENIFLNGAILGMSRREIAGKLDEIVAFSGIENFIDTPVKRYSSGMYVRLAFAVAAHLEPEILIVDEVLAVGDAEFQKKCLGKMGDVSRSGRTILFVSHNLVSMQALCTTGILLESGILKHHGTIQDSVNAYLQANQQIAARELAGRKDRSGNGPLRFTRAEILNSQGKAVTKVITGEDITLRLHFNNAHNMDMHGVIFAAAVYNSGGQQIIDFNNESVNGSPFSVAGGRTGYVQFEIPRLPFVSGVYTGNVFCRIGSHISDWVQTAFSFEIEPGDYYGTGKNSDASQNLFLLPYTARLIV